MTSLSTCNNGNSSLSEVETVSQFLFTDDDFENKDFHAASFVAKYRRATSLDSLRSQLRLYCQSLKDQLYNIINRDYKDFITIATKLEGVDNRVDHLRKPLIELRMDLTVLHDTMVSNLHAISAKIQQRREIANRRRLVQSSLACMTKLTSVEEVLNIKDSSSSNEAVTRSNSIDKNKYAHSRPKLSRRALMNSAQSKSEVGPERLELYQCSELERASMVLAEAHQHLCDEKKNVFVNTPSKSNTSAMRRTLELRAKNIHSALLARLEFCCKVLMTSTTAGKSVPTNTSTLAHHRNELVAMSPCRRRSLGHLIRGVVELSNGWMVENLVSELFAIPAIKQNLTQGRVDGSLGRGSFSGLGDCLMQVVHVIKLQVSDALVLVEELLSQQFQTWKDCPPIDLVVNGVWVPVLNTLKKNYSGMFSSGMADVFHSCYNATHQFIEALCEICGPQWKDSITKRLKSHQSYVDFKVLWKMDLYFQVVYMMMIVLIVKSSLRYLSVFSFVLNKY